MKNIYTYARVEVQRIIDRLYLRRYYPAIMYLAILITSGLSVLFVFTLPQPIRPRTSIGLMNTMAALALFFLTVMRGTHQNWLRIRKWNKLQYSVALYFLCVLLSLVFTKTIYDTTPLRLLLAGVVMFFLTGEVAPSEAQKRQFIHTFGFLAVLIATLGLLQVAFPTFMNTFANVYLKGREAYGITIEFNRGRLLLWGALIFIYPFFYTSTLLLGWRSRFWTTIYIIFGYITILGSMVIANFRWTYLVFFGGSFVYVLYAYRHRYVSARKVRYLLMGLVLTVIVGLVVAKISFGYNLLDRFLLRNPQRDITESLGRITLFNQALTVFQTYPLFGVGYGNYYSAVWSFFLLRYFSVFDQYVPYPVPIAAHNEFYTVLAETGIFGFITYLLVMYFIGRRLYTLLFRTQLAYINRLFVLTLGASFFTIITFVQFENMYPQNIVYLLVMGGIITHWISPLQKESHETPKK